MRAVRIGLKSAIGAVLSPGGVIVQSFDGAAQQNNCTTTFECARQALNVAAKAESAVKNLEKQLTTLENVVISVIELGVIFHG